MFTLNIFPGISHFELLDLLFKARKEASWDSLRLVGLHPADVARVSPVLLQFLAAERHRRKDHQWNTLLIFWLVPSIELENFILEIISLQIFNSVYFKCSNASSPLPLETFPTRNNTSLPQSILARAISSPSIEKMTFCNMRLSREDTKLLCDEVMIWYNCVVPPSPWQQPSSSRPPGSNTKKLRSLEFVTCSFEEGGFHYIGNAIRALPSLDTLKLWYNELTYEDQIHLLRSLYDHPSLTRLDWMERAAAISPTSTPSSNMTDIDGSTPITQVSTTRGRPSLEEVLDRVLSSPNCHIRVLGLSVGSQALVGSLFSRLTSNASIEWLDLSYNGTRAATAINAIAEAQIFGTLHKFRTLRNLDLFCTRLSATAFRSLIAHPVPTLEHISCWGDDLWEGRSTDHANTVLEILETHPNFVEFYGGLHWRTVQVQFLFDIRHVYRRRRNSNATSVVVCSSSEQTTHKNPPTHEENDENTIVPSLWPLILERANRLLYSDLRRSRALYWLLDQGPAFLALPLNQPCSSTSNTTKSKK